MAKNRRDVLKWMLAGGVCAVSSGLEIGPRFQFSSARAAIPGKTLVKVFLRGGADGLNLIVPYADPDYPALRPNIRLVAPNSGNPDAVLDLDGFFGLHPMLSPLQEIWAAGDLAVLPATHFDDASRSHFENQRWIEQGVIASSYTGYFNRYLAASPSCASFPALAAGSGTVPDSMRGTVPVPAITRVNDFGIQVPQWCAGDDCSENLLYPVLQTVYGAPGSAPLPVESTLHTQGAEMVEKLELMDSLDDNYTADAGGLSYSTTGFGRGLALTAQLIKAGVGLEVVTMDWSVGWDTHSAQRPPGVAPSNVNFGFHAGIRRGAEDMLTFWRDLGALRNDVILVFGTEFGRTMHENGSFGTDHGHAAAWWAIGGPVNGGVYGDWPGLSEQALNEGRFLEHSINYKDVIAEALVRHIGMSQSLVGTVFPDHAFTDNGIFSGSGV